MGYRKQPKQYRLTFEDPGYAGLEIVMGSLTVGEYTDMLAATQADGADQAGLMAKMMAGKLISWNLEDEFGNPVEASYEGVEGQELDFIQQIVVAWMTAIASVPPPLPAGSNGSGQYPAASMPMEPLSPSHQN
jgi:hypothetical protein